MKNWKTISLLTAIVLGSFIFGVFYVFNLKVLRSSSKNIEFSPGQFSPNVQPGTISEKPKNIIVFIADGMGFSHLSLAMLTQQVEGVVPVWEQFDIKGWHDPRSSYGPLTDSGASATALATGTSTYFEVIGMNQDGTELTNLFEVATKNQYNTGIVTDSYIWDATPAAFVAHTKSRDNARDIMVQMSNSELDLLFGELEDVGEDEVPDLEPTLKILKQRFRLLDASLNLPARDSILEPVAAIFEEDEIQDLNSTPNLTRLTDVALDYLTSQDAPFVLLVESEEMDAASHRNDSKRVLKGLQSIQETLSHVLSFAEKNGETLVLFTSDHETGGLAIVSESNYPHSQMVWATTNHSAAVVPLYAKGPGAEHFTGVNRNWQVGSLLKSLISSK
jgi:alkaline phosphatase